MRILITFASLFISIALLQLSSGAMGPLDVLSGLREGFSKPQIGLLGSAQFLGFFIGCWWAPRLMGTVGHSRTFAVFAASGAIGAIAHPMWIDPHAWALMRVMTGLCVAGCYTVIEAWMQAKVTNKTRGQVMGVYRVVDIVASSSAQLMIGVLEPASYISYNLLAIFCCACLFPLTLSKSKQPDTPSTPRLRPIKTVLISPLAAAGVVVAGITTSSFRMVGPLYGQEVGLSAKQTGYFLATVFIGGAVSQFPAGWLADKFDRRWILIILSSMSIAVCGAIGVLKPTDTALIFAGAALFGLTTFPIFSVSTAHANDFVTPQQVVEINASLMFLYGVGAIFSPLVSSNLIERFGPYALFLFIATAHFMLVAVSLTRMLVRPTKTERTSYAYIPRTSFMVGKLFNRQSKTKTD